MKAAEEKCLENGVGLQSITFYKSFCSVDDSKSMHSHNKSRKQLDPKDGLKFC